MANSCNNHLKVSGSVEAVQKLKDKINSIPLDKRDEKNLFKTLVGISIEVSDEDYNINWHNINYDSWGTSYDISYNDCNFQNMCYEDGFNVIFDTGWTPARTFAYQLYKQYGVCITLEYSEEYGDFAGIYRITKKGKVKDKKYNYLEGLYHIDIDYFWMELPITEFIEANPKATLNKFIKTYKLKFIKNKQKLKFLNELFQIAKREHKNQSIEKFND